MGSHGRLPQEDPRLSRHPKRSGGASARGAALRGASPPRAGPPAASPLGAPSGARRRGGLRERADRIARVLDELVPETPIPLDHRSPFTLLVAVLLSAQTTDERVNQVTPALFAEADTPERMARVSVARILGHIRSCGLAPTKAKNIRALSEQLVADHGGAVPADLETLETLPGVGHKTASVVMAQAFGVPAFPVDTHIHRLAARWGLSSGRRVEDTERDLKKLYPPEAWNRLHLQLIWFGRRYCPARGHDLDTCPICSWAATRARKDAERRRKVTRIGARSKRALP